MTAPAVTSPAPPAPVAVPAVASLAIRPLVAGPVRRLSVLGTSAYAAWLTDRTDVLVISARDATRLPNCVELPVAAAAAPLPSLRPDDTVTVGGGRVVASAFEARIVRWWDPRATLPPVAAAALASRLRGLPDNVPAVDTDLLARALRSGQSAALLEAAGGLLGLGGGLTPEADDVLAGAFAGVRCLGTALGVKGAVAGLDAIASPLRALAMARTTTFSAALLDHAVHGRVAMPAGAFLNALAGRGDVAATHAQLAAVGHSSGPALAAGVVLAGRTLIESEVEGETK